MSEQYYASYEVRKGIKPISWEVFHGLCKGLALAASTYDPQIILGIARGGLYAATLISHLLRKDLWPIYLTRRANDTVKHDHPVWLIKPPTAVAGARVLIVDEICGSGETLSMVKDEVLRMGAAAARCAVMYAHQQGSHVPNYIGLITDELVLNPWDRECLKDGEFVFHPEYVWALEQQNIPPERSLLLGIEAAKLAKDTP